VTGKDAIAIDDQVNALCAELCYCLWKHLVQYNVVCSFR